jgi:flagellar biosynthesis protein FlhB
MAEKDGQDKTEKATSKRREEARDEGQVAKSIDLNSVGVLLMGVIGLQIFGGKLILAMTDFMRETYLNLTSIKITISSLPYQTVETFRFVFPAFALVLGLVFLAALIMNISQVGLKISKKALIPKFNKINPISGIKRLFSVRSIVELLKGLVKMAIVGFIGYRVIMKNFDDFFLLANMSIWEILSFAGMLMLELAIKVIFILIIVGIADYAYQRYEHEKQLKMTKQEVKDENKQYENPEIKGRIRSKMVEGVRRRMMAAVPDATVVVTNPTHLAIALQYKPENKSDAPKCVAKGKRKVAEKIKEIALAHNVPIIENKPLAWQLYDVLEPGMEIPIVFYQAVAEILAQVYSQKKKKNPLDEM